MYVSDSDRLAASLKVQGAAMVALTSVAFECLHQVTEVNLKAAKGAFAEQRQSAAPAAEKALAYSHQIQEIIAATQIEFQKILSADYEQNSRRAQDYIAHVVKHLPACADATTALWQSAFAAANGTIEAAKQATELAKANIAAANSSRAPA